MNSNYLSITLGPITRIISLAESTKELWAASYFFSYLAKQLIKPFKEREFLLPKVNEEMWGQFHGAGVFPDKYIFKAEPDDFENLNSHVDNVLSIIAVNIGNLIIKPAPEIYSFLKSTLKIYFFEKELSLNEKKDIVKECEHTLNLIEMQDSFPSRIEDGENFLSSLFKNINGNPVFDKDTKKIKWFH